MRERITLAFVVIALAVMGVAGGVRAVALRHLITEQEQQHLQHAAEVASNFIDERVRSGVRINRAFLSDLVDHDTRLSYAGGGPEIVVRGHDYNGADDPEQDVSATVRTATGARVTISESHGLVSELYFRDLTGLLAVLLLVSLGAGLVGWWIARRLSEPFRQLAVAAGDLGRGRFDLSLPRSRMPEVQAIGKALRAGAAQLAARVSREREFAEHASHELRTPITSLRLELDDLALRDDVPDDVRRAAERCQELVDRLDASADELVGMARQGSLVEGAEVPLPLLATQITQRWSDALGEGRREVSASAEGTLHMTMTPGPVEQVLDLVLADVRGGSGPVRLNFIGGDSFLRVKVSAGAVGRSTTGVEAARDMAKRQGGRISGDAADQELELLMPRR